MTTVDWADEIARDAIGDLWHHEGMAYGSHCYTEDYPDELAKLLRKAKADGMREAADLVMSTPLIFSDESQIGRLRQELLAAASKLDPPTS